MQWALTVSKLIKYALKALTFVESSQNQSKNTLAWSEKA
jgi:hypothetical protein